MAVLSVEWAKRVVRWHRLFRSDDSTSCDPRFFFRDGNSLGLILANDLS